MFAIIESGGKQYKVASGQKLRVERLKEAVGSQIVIHKVLLHSDEGGVSVGTPMVEGATVKAKILSHGKSDKVRIFKLRRRKNSKKQQGHRQGYSEIEIEAIAVN